MVILFNIGEDQTVTYRKVGWTVNKDSFVRRAIAEAVNLWAPVGTLQYAVPRFAPCALERRA